MYSHKQTQSKRMKPTDNETFISETWGDTALCEFSKGFGGYLGNYFPGGSVLKNLPKQETRVWSLGQKDPLEKEMAAHSSVLAWEIPWTVQTCGLQSTQSQRVGHDWVTKPSPPLPLEPPQLWWWPWDRHKKKLNVLVPQSCPTLCNPIVCRLPGSSVHSILQTRTLE